MFLKILAVFYLTQTVTDDNRQDNNDGNAPVSAKYVRQALETLEYALGKTSTEALVHDLEFHGIVLLDHKSYSLSQIEDVLKQILGDDGAPVVIDRLRKELQIVRKQR